MGKLKHYAIGKRNLKNENHWEALDSANFRVTKPTVLCFGGNTSLQAKDGNYMCKVAQSLVGIKDPIVDNEIATTQDVDFVGVGYGDDETIGFGKKQTISPMGSLTEEEIAELANNIFTPLYMDEMMKRRPVEQILKNFNKITFFSHCYGAAEVYALIHKVYENMWALGFKQETIQDAINQLCSVSYAPWQVVPCPGLQVIPEKDGTVLGGPARAKIAMGFLDNRHRYPGEGTVAYKENENTVSLIVSSMTHNESDEHPIGYVQRDDRWQLFEKDVAYADDVSKAMGVALSYSIASGIQNQNSQNFIPKLTPDELLQKIQSVLGKTQNDKFAEAIQTLQAEENTRER